MQKERHENISQDYSKTTSFRPDSNEQNGDDIFASPLPHSGVSQRQTLPELIPEPHSNDHAPEHVSETTRHTSAIPDPSSLDFEFEYELAAVRAFMSSSRFEGTLRPYTALDVVKITSPLRFMHGGTSTSPSQVSRSASSATSRKLWETLTRLREAHSFALCFGSLSPDQAVYLAQHLTAVHVGSENIRIAYDIRRARVPPQATGPVVSKYTKSVVAHKVSSLHAEFETKAQIRRAETFSLPRQERIQQPRVDYYVPIIAEMTSKSPELADTLRETATLLTAGAAGLVSSDFEPGFGVLPHEIIRVARGSLEQIARLGAIRMQSDASRCETVIFCKLDSEMTSLIEDDGSTWDHQLILGTPNPSVRSLIRCFQDATDSAASQATEHFRHLPPGTNDFTRDEYFSALVLKTKMKAFKAWERRASLCTYPQCVRRAILDNSVILDKEDAIATWQRLVAESDGSFGSMRSVSRTLGVDPFWSHERVRTMEGRYRVIGGIEMAIHRALCFAPYTDALWLESSTPVQSDAIRFAKEIRRKFPNKLLAYSLAPTLEWGSSGQITNEQVRELQEELQKAGYSFFFVPTAGLVINALGSQAFLSSNPTPAEGFWSGSEGEKKKHGHLLGNEKEEEQEDQEEKELQPELQKIQGEEVKPIQKSAPSFLPSSI